MAWQQLFCEAVEWFCIAFRLINHLCKEGRQQQPTTYALSFPAMAMSGGGGGDRVIGHPKQQRQK